MSQNNKQQTNFKLIKGNDCINQDIVKLLFTPGQIDDKKLDALYKKKQKPNLIIV